MRKLIFIFLFTQSLSAAYLLDPLSTQFPDLNANDLPSSELPDLSTTNLNLPVQLPHLSGQDVFCFLKQQKASIGSAMLKKSPYVLLKTMENKTPHFMCREDNNCNKTFAKYTNLSSHCSRDHKATKLKIRETCNSSLCRSKFNNKRKYSYKSLHHNGRCKEIAKELEKNKETKKKEKEAREQQKKTQPLASIEEITLEKIISLQNNLESKKRSACPDILKEPEIWEETIELFKENYKNPYQCQEEKCRKQFSLRKALRTHLAYHHTAPKKPQETCKKCRNKKSFNSLHPNGQCLSSKPLCKKIAQLHARKKLTEQEKVHLGKISKIAFYLAAIAPLK